MNKNLPYYLGFSYADGIGPVRFDNLIKQYGSVERAYKATIKDFDAEKVLKELKEKGIHVLTREDKLYPPQLKELTDPPICLYVKGDLSRINFKKDFLFSVVGTRRPTSYGIQVAKKLASDLAISGFVIVSGMAAGVDALAHWAALENKAKTIAVLGCGVDIIYPPSNKKLYDEIVKEGGIVISEFPPGMQTIPGLFVSRNRIVSVLSRGVLVVEGAKDSGSLITARLAAEQGKDVFATPGPITSEMSEAPNLLIREGARLTTSVEDILEEFNLRVVPSREKELDKGLSEEERKVFYAIKNEPKFIDEIIAETQMDVNKVLNITSMLEIKGIIEKNRESRYQTKI